ncbi:MAG: Wadjet anti-phage system protein JetA family protein [Chthoniobacteraceae bacterium]
MHLLSERLSRSVSEGFFRPLARPSAPVYIDCADKLEQSADESGQLSHGDALVLIREVLSEHPNVQLAEDEGAQITDLRQRAGTLFSRLTEARWVTERRVSLDEHWVLIAPELRPLLRLLRELAATDDAAELKDFAATLRSICKTLLAEGALDPARLSPEEMRQTVKELSDRVGRAIDQLHAVEKLIMGFEERQRISPSAESTLRVFYTEFYEGEHMICYDVLQQGGLGARLNLARAAVQEALGDSTARERLATGLEEHRQGKIDSTEAYALAERMLGLLERSLGSISARAQIIDGRIADFARLSAERYRYQTELRGRRPEQVKTYMMAANAAHSGLKFSDLASRPGMTLRVPGTEITFGRDALSRPRKARLPVDLSLSGMPGEADAELAQDQIRQRNLYAITPQRAARLIEELLPEKGASVSTADFRLRTEDDLFDLLAVLAFERAHGTGDQRGKGLQWRIRQARAGDAGLEPESLPRDVQSGHRIERFSIERTA